MNGVHDMGGMHGLGPVERESDEPMFHAEWEKRVLALTLATGAWKKWNLDESRHARELIHGPDYLRMSYYEKWLVAVIEQMVETGMLTREEVESGRPAPDSPRLKPPLTADRVAGTLARGGPADRDVPVEPRYRPGDRVRTRNLHPTGHTRLPRYARGKPGVIARCHGVHVFPDANAHGQGEQPQPLYSVRIEARDLWGNSAGSREAVYLDLWEAHLEPA